VRGRENRRGDSGNDCAAGELEPLDSSGRGIANCEGGDCDQRGDTGEDETSTSAERVRGLRKATVRIAAVAPIAPTSHGTTFGPGTWTNVPLIAAGWPSIVTGTDQ
jgi:hypothetical protein